MLCGLRLNKMASKKRQVDITTLSRVISVELGHGLKKELEMRNWKHLLKTILLRSLVEIGGRGLGQ